MGALAGMCQWQGQVRTRAEESYKGVGCAVLQSRNRQASYRPHMRLQIQRVGVQRGTPSTVLLETVDINEHDCARIFQGLGKQRQLSTGYPESTHRIQHSEKGSAGS